MSEAWNTLRSQIEFFAEPFPESAIAFADEHRAEVTPYLVASIARLAEHPEEDANPDYVLHHYAMHILATWRESAAYAPLVRLGHHADDVVYRLLGDSTTESYGRCLASVCDWNPLPLQGLVEDFAASPWSRNAALDAMLTRVFEGDAAREELIAYLIRLGDAEAARWAGPTCSDCSTPSPQACRKEAQSGSSAAVPPAPTVDRPVPTQTRRWGCSKAAAGWSAEF